MEISFIMVKPSYPSNIGAAARAIKAMGFKRLVVTEPEADLANERVRKLGKHADDIIDAIEVFPSLESALAGVDISLAASHRVRRVDQAVMTSRTLGSYLADRSDFCQHAAIVVGPESTGLCNDDVAKCDAVVQIPCAHEQPSLNLAQAVMVLAYELSELGLRLSDKQRRRQESSIQPATYHMLKQQVGEIFDRLAIDEKNLYRQRAIRRLDALSAQDLRLVHKLRSLVKLSH